MFLELSRLPTHVYLGIYNINTFTGIFSKIFKVLFILYLLKMKWLLLKQELIKQDVLTQELSWQDEFGTCCF